MSNRWLRGAFIFTVFPIENKLVCHLLKAKAEANFLVGVIPQHFKLCKFYIEVKFRLIIARISQVVWTFGWWAEYKEMLLHKDTKEKVSLYVACVYRLSLWMIFLIRYQIPINGISIDDFSWCMRAVFNWLPLADCSHLHHRTYFAHCLNLIPPFNNFWSCLLEFNIFPHMTFKESVILILL